MLYRIHQEDASAGYLERKSATTLKSLSQNFKESDLQRWLIHHLDTVIRTDELVPIQQARPGREEADIMAVDKSGRLFLFELKRWESESVNLLQVMRYAQLTGSWQYADLNKQYKQLNRTSDSLERVHQDSFGLSAPLPRAQWNKDQVLTVITNGLDYETRKAIKYWRSKNLDIRAWIYRVYEIAGQPYLDIDAFGQDDDPYEDRPIRYHLINTNHGNDPVSHDYMLEKKRAAAFYDPWKNKIDQIEKNDWVFLYKSGAGIVACGKCVSDVPGIKAPPHGPQDVNEEHYIDLEPFFSLSKPLSARQLRDVADYHVPLISTYTPLRISGGEALKIHCQKNSKF